ncbi:MAG: flagellar motor switch protein FliM [Firmicutes bacterium HGW-Firmicutes-12]|nr:MAG: flagellar motor switch protein FliM [Firmicutes bacterium HGW-Firmicutes-12]
MSEVLSQSEIDALLSALQSGEVDVDTIRHEDNTRKVRVYDFRRPSKFSKDQLYTLEVIYDNFSRLLSTFLSGSLRSRVNAKVVSVDQITYEEFIRSIPNPTILNIFSMEPLEGKAIFEINPIIGFSIIDRLFGGPGLSNIKGRPLTEIERNVMEKLSEKILSLFHESWLSLIDLEAFLETIEINPQFTQVLSPLEMVIIITINMQIAETEGLVNICLPCLMLEPLSEKLNTKFWFSNSVSNANENSSFNLQKVIEKTTLTVAAVLGINNLSVYELLGLQVGDVIPLEQNNDKEINIYVESKLKYHGKPGLLGNKIAVQISNVCMEGSDENE